MRLANAPVSYGVFELTAGDANLPDPDDLLAAIAGAGYEGTELGPPGYLGDGPALAARLERHRLALVASFLPMRFLRPEHRDEDAAELDRVLARLGTASPGGTKPVILLSDAFCEPDRLSAAGRIDETPSAWLGNERFDTLVANLHRAAECCRERGFPVSFHYHGGTYVETPREIDRLVERLRAAGYDGWLVVEQDRYVQPGQTLADLAEDQAENRAYLAGLSV